MLRLPGQLPGLVPPVLHAHAVPAALAVAADDAPWVSAHPRLMLVPVNGALMITRRRYARGALAGGDGRP